MTTPARERRWWLAETPQKLDSGDWDVRIQFPDGHLLRLTLANTPELDQVIAAAAEAHLRGDRRPQRQQSG